MPAGACLTILGMKMASTMAPVAARPKARARMNGSSSALGSSWRLRTDCATGTVTAMNTWPASGYWGCGYMA